MVADGVTGYVILLVELAICVTEWLRIQPDGPSDLYYDSMDFEEEPIFALHLDSATNLFVPESVWAESDPEPVTPQEAQDALEAYTTELRKELANRLGVELNFEQE